MQEKDILLKRISCRLVTTKVELAKEKRRQHERAPIAARHDHPLRAYIRDRHIHPSESGGKG